MSEVMQLSEEITKMQLDVDIESTFRFTYMKCTDKQKEIKNQESRIKNQECFY